MLKHISRLYTFPNNRKISLTQNISVSNSVLSISVERERFFQLLIYSMTHSFDTDGKFCKNAYILHSRRPSENTFYSYRCAVQHMRNPSAYNLKARALIRVSYAVLPHSATEYIACGLPAFAGSAMASLVASLNIFGLHIAWLY